MGSRDDLIEIGVAARAHGIVGEVRVQLHNPESTALEAAETVRIGQREYAVQAARSVAGAYLVQLAGVADRDQAAALRGLPVSVARSALGLEDGDVLLRDLVGCRVELTDGTAWGAVAGVEIGPQARLVIHDGSVERLLPVVDELVVDIDVEGGRVVVDPPEDLPEEERRDPRALARVGWSAPAGRK